MAFQPDLVWIKSRNTGTGTSYHGLWDSVRGTGGHLYSSLPNQETNTPNRLYSFDSNGFSLGNGIDPEYIGNNNYVAWCWKAAGAANTYNVLEGGTVTSDSTASGAGITAGTITTGWEVSANRDAGFSIVSFTAPSTEQNFTVGHGLSQKPDMVILKSRDGGAWFVWHKDLSQESYYLYLTDSYGESDLTQDTRIWGQQSFTDSVISTRSDYTVLNNHDCISYCFHSVDGYQKVGSYQGSGVARTVYTTDDGTSTGNGGFQPRFVMIKRSNGSGRWLMIDYERTPSLGLAANLNNSEGGSWGISFLANGFTLNGLSASDGETNASGGIYIYLAIA